jgi:hypothetical protein
MGPPVGLWAAAMTRRLSVEMVVDTSPRIQC